MQGRSVGSPVMAYQSLYRRYRSQRFSEVRGQPHVVTALHNAVRDGRTGHAYLFSGPRGTGKTSTARILAKALNCTNLDDGEPCGRCESCLAIEAGTSYDLHELDAASNNGVDAVRDLIEKTSYGTSGRTKVYILDEVHMLSRAASNALLKTLEEPPAHVVFVLATTDPQKVLPTIRSRTQHFEFHLLPMDVLDEHVRWVISDAGLDVDEEAITYVLRAGGGSARDTLSALDQVVAAGGVLADTGGLEQLVDALCDADAGRALVAVDQSLAAGRDARLVGEDLLGRLRDIFLCRMGVPLDRLPEADRDRVAGWAERLGDRAVTRAMELLGDAITEISHQALDPRVSLEVALLRIARPEADADVEALATRLDRIEKTLAGGAAPQPPPDPAGLPGRTAAEPTTDAPTAGEPTTGDPTASEPAFGAPTADEAGRSGGAASARAALSDKRQRLPAVHTREASPTPTKSASMAPPPVPGQHRDEPSAHDASQTEARSAPDAVRARPASSPAAAETASASSGAVGGANGVGAAPDRDVLTMAWADSILPALSGLTRAMFSVGRFLTTTDEAAVFALPNEVHRNKCLAKLGDVEDALARHFGHAVTLRLVVDDGAVPSPSAGGSASGDASPARSTGRGAESHAGPEEHEELVDVAALEDAPPDPRTPIDRIAEAFPGARVESEE